MYIPWKPLSELFTGDFPSLELTAKGRSLTLDRYVWRDQVCVSGIRNQFGQDIAGIYVIDERVEITTNYSALPSEFDNSDAAWRGCEMWFEQNSSCIELYGEMAEAIYVCLNSYCLIGQNVVVVVDAEHEPTVVELSAESLPTWDRD